ncbi:MAG: NFACT RNA binding domain-containing protein [Candidatus Bilamarchaeaceae archaeon]
MRIKLFLDKSVHENAAYYYQLAKETRKKMEGAERAIEETKKEIERAQAKKRDKTVRIKREKKWYEKFHWFYTSEGKLAVGGRNAQQNDIVFKRYMEDNDLFFHADIQGASAVILKDGVKASEQEQLEAAQFAASFSNAWKNGNASVDVYAVRKNQLSKAAPGGFVPAGAFAITGERKWFRETKLSIRIGIGEHDVEIVPECSKRKLENEVCIVPSNSGKEKGEISRVVAKKLNIDVTEVLEMIPSGRSVIAKG